MNKIKNVNVKTQPQKILCKLPKNINFNKKLAQEIIEEIKEKTSNYYIHIPSSPNQF